jgi:hypothetical protein
MAYEAADRDGGGIGTKEVRLFLQYQLFYDDAWEIFADMDTNADGVLSEKEFVSNIDLLKVKIENPKLCYAVMDKNGDGKIDLREFAYWLGQMKYKEGAEATDVTRAFDVSAEFFPVGSYPGLQAQASSVSVPAIMTKPIPASGDHDDFMAFLEAEGINVRRANPNPNCDLKP